MKNDNTRNMSHGAVKNQTAFFPAVMELVQENPIFYWFGGPQAFEMQFGCFHNFRPHHPINKKFTWQSTSHQESIL